MSHRLQHGQVHVGEEVSRLCVSAGRPQHPHTADAGREAAGFAEAAPRAALPRGAEEDKPSWASLAAMAAHGPRRGGRHRERESESESERERGRGGEGEGTGGERKGEREDERVG